MAVDGRLVGIDLGTTVSVIAQLDREGLPTTIPNEHGDPLTPSVIYLDGRSAVVGRIAKEAALDAPEKVAMFVKRDMGSPLYSRKVDGRQFRPETLSAMILRKLKIYAEKKIGPISNAVITVPAYFDDTRRKATEDAGQIAGLNVYDILNEPTAAALSYAMQTHRSSGGGASLLDIPGGAMTAVVFDLGGGTLDVTVVRLHSRRFETIATDGEVQLGGKDWDDKIVDYLASQFKQQFRVDPAADSHRRAAMLVQAEKAKVFLSTMNTARIEVSHAGHTLQASLSRPQFEEMTANLLERARVAAELVVRKQAKLGWDEIDQVLLVGGSTKMPMIKNMLRKLTGKEPNDTLNPDQVVAQGAAIHAAIMAVKAGEGSLPLEESIQKDLNGVVEINVNSHNLGVEANRPGKGTVNSVLVPKNTQLPFAYSRVYYLPAPGMTQVRVKVLEGDAEEAAYNTAIGDCSITGLPTNLAKGSPIQVRLAYGANGRVSVMALDMTYGKFAQAEIQRGNRLNDEDIQTESRCLLALDLQ